MSNQDTFYTIQNNQPLDNGSVYKEQFRSFDIKANKDAIQQMIGGDELERAGEDLYREATEHLGGDGLDKQHDEHIGGDGLERQFEEHVGGDGLEKQHDEHIGGDGLERQYDDHVGGDGLERQFEEHVGGDGLERQFEEHVGGGERKDKINDELLIEKSMNEELIEEREQDEDTQDEDTQDEEDLEEDLDEDLDEDFELEFDDEMEEDVELIIKKSETEYTAEDEIIYRDLLHSFRKNPQYISKFKVNKDTNIVQLPEHIVKLSKKVDDIIEFKNDNYSNKKLETIPIIDYINHSKYPLLKTNRIIPVILDMRRVFKKQFKYEDNILLDYIYYENQNTYLNTEKEYQPILFNGTKGIEEYKRNRKLTELWRNSYVNHTSETRKEREITDSIFFAYSFSYNDTVSIWKLNNNGNYIPKKESPIFRFVDDNSCINMNQPNKQFMFDNRVEVLRIESEYFKNTSDNINLRTFCTTEEDVLILSPRTVLGPNYGVSFNENDNIQLTKNYDGEVLDITGYLILPSKCENLTEYIKSGENQDILYINDENMSNIDNIFDYKINKSIFLSFVPENMSVDYDSMAGLNLIKEGINYFNQVIPDVNKLTTMVIDHYHKDIVDVNNINKLFEEYGIKFDMLYKDSYYQLLDIVQENIFNDIDNIVKNHEIFREIINNKMSKEDNYKSDKKYVIYKDIIINNELVNKYHKNYIDIILLLI